MAYIKTEWKSRKGVNLNRFEKSQESNRSVILENSPNAVTEPGTPISVNLLNKIEQGIFDAHELVTTEEQLRIEGDADTLESANNYTDGKIAGEVQARTRGDADTLDAAKEYTNQTVLAGNDWLPAVKTKAQLRTTGLLNTRNYLCKVVADGANSGVYQAIAGWTTAPVWALYDTGVDFVEEEELAAAISGHNTNTSAHPVTLTAPVSDSATPAAVTVQTATAGLLQTIWNKLLYVYNTLANKADTSALTTHTNRSDNPHGVTKAQVGLGNVSNDAQLKTSDRGAVNGVASLGANRKVPLSELPDEVAGDLTAILTQMGQKANDADVVKLSGNQTIAGVKTFSSSPAVPNKSSAAGNNPAVVATEAQVALKANDADVVKLTGNQTIAGTKTFSSNPVIPSKSSAAGNNPTVVATEAQVALKANLASPVFTGTPKIPNKTAAAGTDGTLIASEAQINSLSAGLLNRIYPIGSIYMSVVNTSPATFIGGTWTVWGTGRVPAGIDANQTEFNTVEKTGGTKTHLLVSGELPAHNHPMPHTHNLNSHTHGMAHTHDLAHTHQMNTGSGTGGVMGTGSGSARLTGSANTGAPSNNNTGAASKIITDAPNNNNTGEASASNTDNTGSGIAHNNLQPYVICYMWKRTA